MKLQPLPLIVIFAALTPSVASSQNPQVTNCHTPESAGNFVGSDETLVNGMVCKIVRSEATQQQIVAQQPRAAAPNAQTQATNGKESEITNARVIEMSKLGLDDDIIIARIKHGICLFQLGDANLMDLKKGGVSAKVIAAMLDAAPGTPTAESSVTNAISVAPNPAPAPSDGKVRVFVTDSQSWETRGGSAAGGNKNGWGGSSWMAGGARPQTAEIIKTLNERCPEFTITNNLAKADFVVTLDHEGGKGLLAHRNKIAVFNRDGDDIFSNSTRELGNAVKDACRAMLNSHK
jgi:hypothetical protein